MTSAWQEQLADLPRYLAGHVQLTLLALAIGLIVSLPLGVLATRKPRLESGVLGAASVLQTIPGLALLALMVPLLGVLGTTLEGWGLPSPPSIGFLPAVLALALYSVLPMLRNTVTGIRQVDGALVESARGVGMSPREVLLQVELPLALPTIVAGIRTATVWVVGTATLATPVGGTSLGNPIFAGLQTRNLSAVLIGSLAAAGLALALDGLVRVAEIGLVRRQRGRVIAAVVVLAALGITALVIGTNPNSRGGGATSREVVVGAKSFTEQYILSEILGEIVATEPGHAVRPMPSLGSTVAFDGLVTGDLDLYVDYTGTVWATIFGEDTTALDRSDVLSEVSRRLREEHGIHLLAALGFENTYCLAVRGSDASQGNWNTISDLVSASPGLEIMGDFEFFERAEWQALERAYGFAFAGERAMDSSLMYEALRAGEGDVISAYSTDGRIAAYELKVLEDDRRVIPPYDAIVLASDAFVRGSPALAERIRGLSGRIDAREMRRMNARVDLEGATPASVAREWGEQCGAACTPNER